jgi:hypothetical protein
MRNLDRTSSSEHDSATSLRLAYQKPELIRLGDLRDLTLGGSDGSGDSGDPGTQQPF